LLPNLLGKTSEQLRPEQYQVEIKKYMNDTKVANETAPAPSAPKQIVAGEFGNGRYSNIAKELYADSQRILQLTEPQADKLARTYVADLGRFNAKCDSVSISKPNKDMQVTLKESCKVKGINLTNSVILAKLVTLLQDAKAWGVEKYHRIELQGDLTEWLNS
jgi:hypothetical protein